VSRRPSLRYPSVVGSDRSCTGFKPSQAERKSRKASGYRDFRIRDIEKSRGQEIGSLHDENPETDLSRPSVGTRGGDREPSAYRDSTFHES
jgi:hypothetical protein